MADHVDSEKSWKERVEKHWLFVFIPLFAGAGALGWGACDQLLVRPAEAEKEWLKEQISELKEDSANDASQSNDRLSEAVRVAINGNAARTQAPTSDEYVADFSWVDTNSAPGHIVAAGPYLAALGISIQDLN